MFTMTPEKYKDMQAELEAAYRYQPDFAFVILQAIKEKVLTPLCYVDLVDGRACGCFYGHLSGETARIDHDYASDNWLEIDVDKRACTANDFKEQFLQEHNLYEKYTIQTAIEQYLFGYDQGESFEELVEMLLPFKERYEQSLRHS